MWNVHIRGQLGFRLVVIAVAASRGPSGEGDAFAQLLILLLSSWERNQFPSSFTVLHSPERACSSLFYKIIIFHPCLSMSM